jgi:hypothetical protein
MLGELAEDVAVDLRAGPGRVNRQFNPFRGNGRRNQGDSDQGETSQGWVH